MRRCTIQTRKVKRVSISEVVDLVHVILAFRIGSSQYSTASVQLADKPRLGYTDCLLFHRFVNA